MQHFKQVKPRLPSLFRGIIVGKYREDWGLERDKATHQNLVLDLGKSSFVMFFFLFFEMCVDLILTTHNKGIPD